MLMCIFVLCTRRATPINLSPIVIPYCSKITAAKRQSVINFNTTDESIVYNNRLAYEPKLQCNQMFDVVNCVSDLVCK